ncbi:MAG: Gmad2 immunoglobulin-like domain-containing protein [Anaerolineae bacterium]|nr:Gmad2 immunoglobulin-like domain-containing protein [Anaerolineae bacterium]
MRYLILVLLLVGLLLMSIGVSAQSEEIPEPLRSYLICDWGLLTTEQSTEQPPIFIQIDSPADYSAVEGSRFTISGTGAGLFEGNIIVEVSNDSGEMLFEGTTVLQAEEMGAAGEWSIDIDLGDLSEATPVFVTVYSTSPRDGSTVAIDTLRLNVMSTFGLPYVEITTPTFGAGVLNSPLLVEGMAGSAFENNIVIEVQDFETGDILAESPATIQTEDMGGSGPFSVELSFDAEPGTAIQVYAYQPAVADTDEITVSDVQFAIVSPLAQTYDRFLTVRRDDYIASAEDICAVAEAEFDNENIQPLVINNVVIMSTRSMMPLVNVNIEAAGSSNCPAPLRTRTTRSDNDFDIEVYIDTSEPVPCTADLAPIPVQVSLGTLPSPDFSVMVNGESAE